MREPFYMDASRAKNGTAGGQHLNGSVTDYATAPGSAAWQERGMRQGAFGQQAQQGFQGSQGVQSQQQQQTSQGTTGFLGQQQPGLKLNTCQSPKPSDPVQRQMENRRNGMYVGLGKTAGLRAFPRYPACLEKDASLQLRTDWDYDEESGRAVPLRVHVVEDGRILRTVELPSGKPQQNT